MARLGYSVKTSDNRHYNCDLMLLNEKKWQFVLWLTLCIYCYIQVFILPNRYFRATLAAMPSVTIVASTLKFALSIVINWKIERKKHAPRVRHKMGGKQSYTCGQNYLVVKLCFVNVHVQTEVVSFRVISSVFDQARIWKREFRGEKRALQSYDEILVTKIPCIIVMLVGTVSVIVITSLIMNHWKNAQIEQFL